MELDSVAKQQDGKKSKQSIRMYTARGNSASKKIKTMIFTFKESSSREGVSSLVLAWHVKGPRFSSQH